MKKVIAIVSILILGISGISAQQLDRDHGLLTLGAGFNFPGVGASIAYDYGLIDHWGPGIFTVGGIIGWSTRTIYDDYTLQGNTFHERSNWNTFAMGPRASYRYNITPEFDVAGILGVGFMVENNRAADKNRTLPYSSMTAQARYAFGRFSLFVESGWSNLSFVQLGVNFLL